MAAWGRRWTMIGRRRSRGPQVIEAPLLIWTEQRANLLPGAFQELVVSQNRIVPISRGFSVVIVEQATESFKPSQRAIGRVIVGRLDKRTVETLMRALSMVMGHVLADEFS